MRWICRRGICAAYLFQLEYKLVFWGRRELNCVQWSALFTRFKTVISTVCHNPLSVGVCVRAATEYDALVTETSFLICIYLHKYVLLSKIVFSFICLVKSTQVNVNLKIVWFILDRTCSFFALQGFFYRSYEEAGSCI